jgi:hypothetical protein
VTHRDFSTFNPQWIEQVRAAFITLDAVRLTQAHPPYQLEVDIVPSPPMSSTCQCPSRLSRGLYAAPFLYQSR